MNNQIVNLMNRQFVDVVENVSVDVTFLLSFILSNSCKCFLFIVSMFFFFIFRNHFFDHFWFWDFAFKRLCWENDSKNLSCWKCYRNEYFRCDRFRLFINHLIRWNCDFESQRRKSDSKWTNFFCEKKLQWRRTTTFWCCFVVVVVWHFEIKRRKEFRFFCWFFCFVHWAESNDVHSNLMRILHSMCKIDFFLCSCR